MEMESLKRIKGRKLSFDRIILSQENETKQLIIEITAH
jgi:hypothetical protein